MTPGAAELLDEDVAQEVVVAGEVPEVHDLGRLPRHGEETFERL